MCDPLGILDIVHDMVFIAECATFKILHANQAAQAITGYTQDRLCDRTLLDLCHVSQQAEFSALLGQLSTHKTPSPVLLLQTYDGTLVPAALRIHLGAIQGTQRLVVAAAPTEGQLYRSLVDAIPDLLFRIRRDGTYAGFKIPAIPGLNMPSPEQIIGKKVEEIVPQHVTELVMPLIARVLDTGDMKTTEYQIEEQNGPHDYEARFVASVDDSVVVVVRDITDRKRTEETLKQQEALIQGVAQAASCLLEPGSFTAAISEALAVLGKAARVDRICIFQDQLWAKTGEHIILQRYGWTRLSIKRPANNPILDPMAWFPRWYDTMRQGNPISDPIRDLPEDERQWFGSLGIISLLAAPIFVRNEFWGFIGVDDCQHERAWTTEEVSAFQTMAASVGAAIARQETEDRLRHEHDVADTLRKVGITLTSTLDRDEVLSKILEEARRVVPYVAANIMLIQEPNTAQIMTNTGYEAFGVSQARVNRIALKIDETPILKEILKSHRACVLPDTCGDPRWVRVAEAPWIRSWLGAPIVVRGRVVGIFSLDSDRPNFYNESHVALIDLFVRQAAVAYDNAQLYQQVMAQSEELSQRLDQLKALYTASESILSTLELNEILERLAEQITIIAGASSTMICDYTPDTQGSIVRTCYCLTEKTCLHPPGTRIHLDPTITPKILASKKSVCLTPTDIVTLFPQEPSLLHGWIVPIQRKEQVTGFALIQHNHANHRYDPDTIRMCETLANQASIAIEQATLFTNIRELERTKSEMIRMASHELRRPLTRLNGFITLLEGQITPAPNERQHDYLNLMHDATREIERIVTNILSLERIEARHRMARPVDWCSLIDEAVNSLKTDLQAKQHKLQTFCAPDLPIIRGDPVQLGQAISNLLSNAIKYTPPHGSILMRVFSKSYGGQPHIALEVQDNGIGISTEQQAKIFEPFYRVQQDDANPGEGIGLGLSVVKSAVEYHKGSVYCDSEPGQGSLFGFRIPV